MQKSLRNLALGIATMAKKLAKYNARNYLIERPALAYEIENKVREHLGVPLLPAFKESGKDKASAKASAKATKEGKESKEPEQRK